MDNTKTVTAVEWFYGYGGNHLGLKRAIPGLRNVAVCEREAFVIANMVSKMEKGLMDAVPIWTDCKDFPIKPFEGGWLDLFIASYPCQPFSGAGKRKGTDDERHLWPYCRKFIQGARPRFVWLENVEGHVSLGLSTVLSDLEEDGYKAAWGIFSAEEVGAPHSRKRVFILAHTCSKGLERWGVSKQAGANGVTGHLRTIYGKWPSFRGQEQYEWEPDRTVENTVRGRNAGRADVGTQEAWKADKPSSSGGECEDRGQGDKKIKSPMGGNANGVAGGMDYAELFRASDNRTDEFRMCGNGVVPQTAEKAFRVLYEELCSGL